MSNVTALPLGYLSFCYSRLAHAIRTPLSVSLSVLDDLLQGIAVSPEDLQDAKDSLTSITQTLSQLRELARKPHFEPRLISFDEVGNLATKALDGVHPCAINLRDNAIVPGALSLDPELFQSMLVSLQQWATVRQERNSVVGISWDFQFSTPSYVTLTLEHEILGNSLNKHSSHNLSALAALDHSAPSIALLYAYLICSLHHWATDIFSRDGSLVVTVTFLDAIDE